MIPDRCGRNNVSNSANFCTHKVEYDNYGYNVTGWVSILFLTLFSITFLLHIGQMIKYRHQKLWFAIWSIQAGILGEVIGYAARTISWKTTEWAPDFGGYWKSSDTGFMAQIAVLVVAPAFIQGFNYVILGRLIRAVGPQYSRLSPKTYVAVFVTADVISLVVQAIGGGSAAAAKTASAANKGANVIVVGVFLQLFFMVIFSILFAEFYLRSTRSRPVKRVNFNCFRRKQVVEEVQPEPTGNELKNCHWLMLALAFSTLVVFIRSIYRTIELLDGWRGPIITDEKLFAILDSLMILFSVAIYHLFYPGRLLPSTSKHSNLEMKNRPTDIGIGSPATA